MGWADRNPEASYADFRAHAERVSPRARADDAREAWKYRPVCPACSCQECRCNLATQEDR